MAKYRHLLVSRQEGVLMVRFSEQVLTENLARDEVRVELNSLLVETEDCRKVLLSLAGVTYMTSAMLGRLIIIHGRLKAKGGELKLCDVGPAIQHIFNVAKLCDIMDIRSTESEGLKAFQ